MPPPLNRPLMSDEELQSAADYIRMGNFDYRPGGRYPRDGNYSSLTVTQGIKDGYLVYTVTSSRGSLLYNEPHRAAEIFGMDGFAMSEEFVRVVNGLTNWHSEQRGIRATQGQTDRCQATSNITPDTKAHPNVLHVGAACPPCANAQNVAGVRNVTGTVHSGRINNPNLLMAWRNWKAKWIAPAPRRP
jgi:hypothetical protein